MIDEILTATRSILAHKMRSILTMLGIIIGISAIICIFSIIEGNTENLKKEMIGGSNNTIGIEYNKKSMFNQELFNETKDRKAPYIPEVTDEQLNSIRALKNVQDVGVSYSKDTKIFYKSTNVQANVSAVTANLPELKQLEIIRGKNFDSTDFKDNQQVIYLDKSLYEELFGNTNDGIGKYVEVNSIPFQIKGVFETKDAQQSYMFGSKEAYVPEKQAYNVLGTVNLTPKITIQSTDTEKLQVAAQEVSALLNKNLPESDYSYGIMNMDELKKSIEQFNQSNFILLAGIASISLLVGGIGVMNIMLVSVTERTREIGIKKALGARRKVILRQFLIEAIVLTVLGGILGVLIGLVGGFIITQTLHYPYIVSLLAILGSLAFCLVVGIVFGLLPAVKASKLNPIEALRYE